MKSPIDVLREQTAYAAEHMPDAPRIHVPIPAEKPVAEQESRPIGLDLQVSQ